MSAEDKYFQVPLCSLAYGDKEQDRLDAIISFGFVSAGWKIYSKMDPDTQKQQAEDLKIIAPHDYQKRHSGHVAAMTGAQACGVNPRCLDASIRRSVALMTFRDNFKNRHGEDAEFRIEKSLVFEARDKTGISYREFSILCGLYSCIGSRKYPVRITRKAIQCRMLGYKSPAVMDSEIVSRDDGAQPLTFRQINYDLDKLHERNFLARARANERQTFYSNKMTQGELQDALIKSKSYSQAFHEIRRQRDAETMAKVKAIKANNPIIVDKSIKVNGSNDVHSASTGVSTTVSTLIKTPLIETPL